MYIAPEILKNDPQGLPNDLWSIGVIMYLMLTGVYPFSSKNIDHNIINQPIVFLKSGSNLSNEAKDLIYKLLDKSPTTRITASKALKHPWF